MLQISSWLIIHHLNLFSQIFRFFMHSKTPFIGLLILSKCNGQNRPGTFTLKPDIDIQLSVKLHVALEATIAIHVVNGIHPKLVSWSPGRHLTSAYKQRWPEH